MTRPATLTQAAIDRAVKAAKAMGMAAKITAPDGTIYEFTPVLDAKPESAQPDTAQFDAWKAKREARRAGGA